MSEAVENLKKTRLQYVYMIFVTAMGKGYGCFAIQKQEKPNTFIVSSSYCNPIDQKKFNKTIAKGKAIQNLIPRKRAMQKAEELNMNLNVLVELPVDEKSNYDATAIVRAALENGLHIPSWAKQSYKRNYHFFTLNKDCNSWFALIKLLDARDIAEQIQKHYIEFFGY